MSTSFEEAFSGKEGVQSPQRLQSPTKLCNLETQTNGGPWENVDFAFKATLTNEEALEVKA
jgi:hypothetical protein